MSHSSNSPTHTWDLSHELDHMDLPRNRIAKARLDETTVEPFSVDGIPSVKRIWEAGMCELVDEMGLTVKFKDLINNEPGRKTLVFFIRYVSLLPFGDSKQAVADEPNLPPSPA
jgi:hypothetical protein